MQKRRLAQETKEFNIKDKVFCECFPELTEQINESLKKKREAEAEQAKLSALGDSKGSSCTTSPNSDPLSGLNENRQSHMQIQNWTSGLLSNIFVMIGLAAFAFVVKSVFNE